MQFSVGDGLLTIVSDAAVWSSPRIAELDHAFLLWSLCETSEQVVILYGREVPAMLELLRRYALQPLLLLALCTGAWLWFRGSRFGPACGESAGIRRSLAEQLFARADFLWSNGHQLLLLDAMRTALFRRAERRDAGFARTRQPRLESSRVHVRRFLVLPHHR